jgi:hypothetical protein
MAGDFQIEKGASFGEWLHEQIYEAAHFETETWAIERIQRVQKRLQADRPESERLITEIPWLEEVTAFTAPGRYIYFSRRLYERCPKAQIWAWQRKRGYLPIRDRRQMLLKHLREVRDQR